MISTLSIRCRPLGLIALLSTLCTGCADKSRTDTRDGSSAGTSTPEGSTAGKTGAAAKFDSCVDDDEPGCKAKCDGGDAESCVRLAAIYAFGNANVKTDLPASVTAYTKACDAGLGKSCYYLAGAYGSGRGTKADPEKKAELHKKAIPLLVAACDGEPGDGESCSIIADLHMLGEGVPKDPAKEEARRKQADVLYGKGCERGDGAACSMFAASRISAKDGPGAAKAAKQGCDAGSGGACQVLAGIYDEGFEGVAADPAKAKELFQLACKRGLGASCSRLER